MEIASSRISENECSAFLNKRSCRTWYNLSRLKRALIQLLSQSIEWYLLVQHKHFLRNCENWHIIVHCYRNKHVYFETSKIKDLFLNYINLHWFSSPNHIQNLGRIDSYLYGSILIGGKQEHDRISVDMKYLEIGRFNSEKSGIFVLAWSHQFLTSILLISGTIHISLPDTEFSNLRLAFFFPIGLNSFS